MTKTVLLADDSSTIRKIVELTFNGTEIRVLSFDNGKDAMAHLADSKPDLVLADVVMPGPSGYEICQAVKAANSETPVVLLSSTFEPYDAEMAQESGADSHLVKPFESDTLLTTVRQLLEPAKDAKDDMPERELEPKSVVDTAEIDQPLSPAEPNSPTGSYDDLDERLIEAVSRVVIERLSADVVREIARDVVPDLAERIIRERIQQIENEDS